MNLTPDEKQLLKQLIYGDMDWDSPLFTDIKSKLKDQFLQREKRCCYCAKDFQGEFKLVIDIEHILPKSIFCKQKFDLNNLSIACKRCNMLIKKDKIDFLDFELLDIARYFKCNASEKSRNQYIQSLNPNLIINNELQYMDSKFYKFIHPNIDDYYENLEIQEIRKNGKKFKKYYPNNDKGRYTYQYFKLSDLEQGELDAFQGIQFIEQNKILTLDNVI